MSRTGSTWTCGQTDAAPSMSYNGCWISVLGEWMSARLPVVSWVVLADPKGNEFCLLARTVQDVLN